MRYPVNQRASLNDIGPIPHGISTHATCNTTRETDESKGLSNQSTFEQGHESTRTMKLPLLICILHQTFQIKSQSKSSISFHLKTLGITFDISGIPIVTFQADGSFTRSTYIERKGPFGQEDIFSQLTICLRMTVFYLRGRETYFLSYANPDSADALTGYIERTAFDKTYM